MKRIMSFILAIAMVVGFVPAVFAADTTSVDGYTYLFTNAAHTGTAASGSTAVKFEEGVGDGLHDIDGTVSSESAPWGYVAQSFPDGALNVGTDNTGIRLSYTKPGTIISFNPEMSSEATALCVELTVGAAGEYTPTIKTQSFSNLVAPIVEFYLVPKNAVAQITNANLSEVVKGIDAEYRMGVADTLDGGVAGTYEKTFRKLSLSAGNYYFIAVPNGENARNVQNKNYYFVIASLFLAKNPVIEYDYILTTNQTSGGIDVDTDGDGVDTGMPVDTTLPSTNAAVEAGNSTIGIWKHGTVYKLYNAAIPRFMGDYKYINTNSSSNWAFPAEAHNPGSVYIDNQGINMTTYGYKGGRDEAKGNGYFALKLQIGQADTYDLSFVHNDLTGYEGQIYFSFFPVSGNELNATTIAANKVGSPFDLSAISAADGAQSVAKVTATASGDYYLAIVFDDNQPVSSAEKIFRGVHIKSVHLKGTKSVSSGEAQPGDAEVNVDPGNAEAESGKATISNEVSVLAKDIDGKEIENAVTKNGASATAVKTVGDYEFLYWAKGIGKNQKKVSTDLTYNFTNESEKLWLYAIYRNTKAATENAIFYNANGDIISTVAITDGKITTPALTNVSLAGYGAVKGWKYAVDGVTYGANEEVTVSGDALFVAEYDELNTSIDITVKNGTITVEDGKEKPLFGDKVTVTAPLRDGTKLFNYWMKGDEIVSFDREYSFCAWEACALEAVYTDYVPLADSVRKIILGKAGDTYVAEFIGFDGDDVLERGIAFATSGTASCVSINRAVMTRKDLNHLAAFDDISATSVVGYVIDKAGNVYYSK